MARAWSFRYLGQKLALGAEELLIQLTSSSAQLPDALRLAMDAYKRQMTTVIYIAGAAMVPTLNLRSRSDPDAVERLLVRLIPRPSPRTIFTGDVVAFTTPLAAGLGGDAAQHTMVRRIAAMEGDEMDCDDPDEPLWRVPRVGGS
jgi:hypothetical protein